jgi:hypothetical protein
MKRYDKYNYTLIIPKMQCINVSFNTFYLTYVFFVIAILYDHPILFIYDLISLHKNILP